MRETTPKPVIFTDLDGTLLDEQYQWDAAVLALEWLRRSHIPVVFCSSKTRAEQEFFRQAMNCFHPFIVENGSAIFLPQGYFPFGVGGKITDGYELVVLGKPATYVRHILAKIRQQTGWELAGYADMSLAEVAQITGLPPKMAALAMQREYSETIVTRLRPEQVAHLELELAAAGLQVVSGGRFYTVTGTGADKGRAVQFLAGLYEQAYGRILTIGIGDSPNDTPMLAAVERPFLVQRPDYSWLNIPEIPVTKVKGVGPHGWQHIIQQLQKNT